ncbi:MAG: SDR family NAD(P)-dependent oxidoreductase [Caulobacteraceae bacterium]|nr:SDR family NAD(P)-dependent oxidoreductase [Caulobacteraceae bacterium]
MAQSSRKFALVTGASSGIGLELAKQCAQDGHDLLIAADRPLAEARSVLEGMGAQVETLEVDLATKDGVDQLYQKVQGLGRPVDALLANAGQGLGKGFLDQEWNDIVKVVDTNITGTLRLIHKVGQDMRRRGEGKILITGSIAGLMPGTYQAVYNGTKAFLDSFSFALRHELEDTEVTVTCLMPGATETDFFDRADMKDTKVGSSKKDDPADVAKVGYEAMKRGDGDVVTGLKNKLQAAVAAVTPQGVLAGMHKDMAEPGTAKK